MTISGDPITKTQQREIRKGLKMAFLESMAAIRAGTATEDDYNVIENHEKAVKQESIGHRQRAAEFSSEAEKAKNLQKLLSDNGFDTNADIGEQIKAIKGIPQKKDDEISQLRAEYGNKFAALEAKEKAATEMACKKGAEAELVPELEKVFVDGSAFFKVISFDGLIKYGTDNRPYGTIDGIDYRGAELALKLKEIPAYARLAKNTQNPGGGTGNAGGGNGGKTMSRASFDALSYKEQAAKMKDGYKLF